MYAIEADTKDYKIYNCVQRGHQNSVEALPIFFVLMVLGGIKRPLICSALGIVNIVSRYFYFSGYSSGDPKGRLSIGKYNNHVIFLLPELPIEDVSILQEDIIRRCENLQKTGIVATNKLESIIDHPTPTRAEVFDIAIAVRQGADAMMLSGETAHG